MGLGQDSEAAGLPVFAGTPEKGIGLAYLMGPTGGYLLGYLFAAAICGWLAERLNVAVPGNFLKKTVFVTTVAEAVENAVKLARTHTGRPAITAFGGAFHGRTFMGMSLTGKVAPYKQGFGAMIARKVALALAFGCTFVARPAELTPLSALAMAVLAERAGIPAGVFNVIPSSDSAAIGQEFCSNPKVVKITFTGSTRVGRILMQQCALNRV